MEMPHIPGQPETGAEASVALQGIIDRLLVVEAKQLAHELQTHGLSRALISDSNEQGDQGRSVTVAAYDESYAGRIADLVSAEARALGPFTGHIEFDIRNATTNASGVVYTRKNDNPVILFSRSIDPVNRHSQDSRESFEFTRFIGLGLLWAELLYDERPQATIEREADVAAINGLVGFLTTYLPVEAG